ncbi:hypothetical protein KL86CLO1_11090 [uncultured Eubacteriales bacterium]|uniref:Uncharacterized protein n=1 Tax=uncultured Eubacteriales bacterium TaxID=172733 RepID=A0A212JHB7_9FIRM|nr:hypothetical protein KL86CLO1_11090 [uncultured Eubacteriales bacterium]
MTRDFSPIRIIFANIINANFCNSFVCNIKILSKSTGFLKEKPEFYTMFDRSFPWADSRL